MRSPDEDGSVAVLYTLVLLVMIGFIALVVDMGALRADRRAAQTTADFASVAAAGNLGDGLNGSPYDACVDSLQYFVANVHVTLSDGDIDDFCDDNFPESDADCWTDGIAPISESLEVDPYVVTVTWPVDLDDDIDLYDDEIDGHRCERFEVQVDRTRGFVFANAAGFGADEGQTGARAVARAVVGESQPEVVNLLLLDRYGCNVATAFGGGEIRLRAQEANDPITGEPRVFPGRMYADSDGTWSVAGGGDARRCGSNDYTIDVGGGGRITAEGDEPPDHDSPPWGEIRLFAQPQGAAQCEWPACDEGKVRDDDNYAGAGILPRPINLPTRIGRTPADHTYNCRDDYSGLETPDGEPWGVPACSDANGTGYIDQLRGQFGDASSRPPGFTAWTDILDDDEPLECTVNDPVVLPPGDYYIDCDTLLPNESVEIEGGTVVFQGRLRINNNDGEFIFNKNSGAPGIVYFGGGVMIGGVPVAVQQSRGLIEMNETTTVLYDGQFRSTADADLLWSAPLSGDLENLAFWSDGNAHLHRIEGSGGLGLDGVYFTPNSRVMIRGGGAGNPQNAQFFAWRLWVTGGGSLEMTPDPNRQLPVPTFEGVQLIR